MLEIQGVRDGSYDDNPSFARGIAPGASRRTFMKIGTLGGVGFAGLTLADLLRMQALAQEPTVAKRKKSVILVWLAGGPSHIDMYDLKPQAPSEIRGEFRPIQTNVSGIQISEHLPYQARIMDKLAIVRSAFHTNAGHGMGRLMSTCRDCYHLARLRILELLTIRFLLIAIPIRIRSRSEI